MPWTPLIMPPRAYVRELFIDFGGKARFLVDENLGVEVTRILRDQ
jgi:hypothetical protein